MASHSKLESAESGEGETSPDSYASEPTVAEGEYPTLRDALRGGERSRALAEDSSTDTVRDRDGAVAAERAAQGVHSTANSESRTTQTRPIYAETSRARAEVTKAAEDESDSDREIATSSAPALSAEKGAGGDDDEAVSLDELLISDVDADEEEDEATEIHSGLSEAVEASLGAERLESVEVVHAPAQIEPAPEAARAREDASVATQAASNALGRDAAHVSAAGGDSDAEDDLDQPSMEAVLDEPDGFEAEAELAPVSVAAGVPSAGADFLVETEASEPPSTPDLGEASGAVEPLAAAPQEQRAEREVSTETVEAKRRDAPLPSFEIPDLDAVSPAAAVPISPTLDVRGRVTTRPLPLPPLSEVAEDDEDDDAVTHIGLPVTDTAPDDYPAAGFQVAAAIGSQSLDVGQSPLDSRRATTRVIPRFDPKAMPPRPAPKVGPSISERAQALARRGWESAAAFTRQLAAARASKSSGGVGGSRMEDVLPRASMVLLGSGIGAVIVLLVVQPQRAVQQDPRETQAVQALQGAAPAKTATLAERARAGDGDALYKITSLPPGARSSALTLALEAGYQSQKLREFKDFSKSIRASNGALNAAAITRFVDYASSPETMLATFQELTEWASPSGPDALYAVWERAPGGSRAASLAQQLLYSADQRSKATPALLTALDLRSAASCDDYLRVLPTVLRNGDQRCSATLRAIEHTDGCGGDGQQDCYACLRHDSQLKDTLEAVQRRPSPTP